jgi:hypothetical protein
MVMVMVLMMMVMKVVLILYMVVMVMMVMMVVVYRVPLAGDLVLQGPHLPLQTRLHAPSRTIML